MTSTRCSNSRVPSMVFVILTGASGSGKTVIAEAVAVRHGEQVEVYHFDSIGVPPPEQMNLSHGSGEAWQRAMTHQWTVRIASAPHSGRRALLEGQMRLSFVVEAAAAAGVTDYELVLVDCDDSTRTARLLSSRHREGLATPAMMNWARYLRGEATKLHCPILDTAHLAFDDCVQWAWRQLCR
jgi:chloramphenicol 3-O-phosphotransferase